MDTFFFPELYLEELSDHIEATNVDCQTDAFLDKPPTPLFVPAKTGKDVATQIKDGEVGESGHPGQLSLQSGRLMCQCSALITLCVYQ